MSDYKVVELDYPGHEGHELELRGVTVYATGDATLRRPKVKVSSYNDNKPSVYLSDQGADLDYDTVNVHDWEVDECELWCASCGEELENPDNAHYAADFFEELGMAVPLLTAEVTEEELA